MDLASLGRTVIDLGFTTLGTAFGVPALAPVAAALAKKALGLPETAGPAEIAAAAARDPEALAAADNAAAEMWPALAEIAKANAKQSEEINATIRAEIGTVSWWHWRHLIGYVTVIWALFPVPPLAYLMWTAEVIALNAVVAAIVALTAWFAILAGLNGYVAMDTSRRSTAAAAGQEATTVLGGLIKAVTKKK